MRAQEIMTRDPACVTADDTAMQAAQLMEQCDCGAIPVVRDEETRQLIGMVTDRDIAIRGIARGRGGETPVRELMSSDPTSCAADTDIEEVGRVMAERQVRRIPIVDDAGRCIGMIAQADIARSTDRAMSDREVGHVVERISEPARR